MTVKNQGQSQVNLSHKYILQGMYYLIFLSSFLEILDVFENPRPAILTVSETLVCAGVPFGGPWDQNHFHNIITVLRTKFPPSLTNVLGISQKSCNVGCHSGSNYQWNAVAYSCILCFCFYFQYNKYP